MNIPYNLHFAYNLYFDQHDFISTISFFNFCDCFCAGFVDIARNIFEIFWYTIIDVESSTISMYKIIEIYLLSFLFQEINSNYFVVKSCLSNTSNRVMHMTRVNFPWLQDTMWRDIAINWQSGNICDIYLGIGKCASSAYVYMDETHLEKKKNQLYTWRLVIWLPISPAVTSDTEAWAKLRLFLYAKCVPERIKIQHDSNYRLSLYRKNDVSTKHFATASFTSPLKFMRRFVECFVDKCIVERVQELIWNTINARLFAFEFDPLVSF